jgi:O-antigen/teichoic acid export membrane protein
MTTAAGGERRGFARNASTSYAVRILLGLSVLLLTPYLYRGLGAAGFGTWSVVFTLAAILELVEMGFSTGVVKLVAEERARDAREQLAATVTTAFTILAGLAVAVAAGLLALAAVGAELFSTPDADALGASLALLALAMLVRLPTGAYAAALIGYQRYDLQNVARMVAIVAFPAGAVVAVETGGGVLGVTVAFAASLVLQGVVSTLLLRRLDPELPLAPRADRAARRRIVGLSSFALLAESMNFIGHRMDVVVVAALRSAAAAAPYAAVLKLQTGVQSLVMPFIDLLVPMTSDLGARGRRDEVARRLALATRVTLQMTLPVAAALALFATDAVELWLGESVPAVAASILVLLMCVQAIVLTCAPAERILVGLGRVRAVGTLSLFEGLSNVAISIALVSAHGAIGAAIGSLTASVLFAPLRLPLAARALGQPTARLVAQGVAPGLASSAPALAAMVALHLALPAGPARLALGIVAGIGLAVAVAVAQIGPRRVLDTVRAVARRGSRSDSAAARLSSAP